MSMSDLKVQDVMLTMERVPVADAKTMLVEALQRMNQFRLGIVCIVGKDGEMQGIFTDGDVRRLLLRDQKPFSALFTDDVLNHAVRKPTTVAPGDSLLSAVQVMEAKQIWDLPVVDGGKLVGLLHLHQAVKTLLGI